MYRIFCPACSPSGPLYLTVWPFRVCWSVPTWTFFTLNSSGSGFFGCPEDCGALWPLVLPSSWIWFCSLWSWTSGGVFWLRTSSPKSQSPSVAMTQQRKHCEVMTLWHDLGVSEKVSWILEQQVLLGLKDYKGLKLEKSLTYLRWAIPRNPDMPFSHLLTWHYSYEPPNVGDVSMVQTHHGQDVMGLKIEE